MVMMLFPSMVAGGKVTQINPESAGLNPGWRNAVGGAGCIMGWDEGASSKEIEQLIFQLKAWTGALNDIAPNDGAYFNEVRAMLFPNCLFTDSYAVSISRRPYLRLTGKPPFSGLTTLNLKV